MSTSSKRTVDVALCPKWIYGPQVSEKNTSYGVGGATWKILWDSCGNTANHIYGDFNPYSITRLVSVPEREYKKERLVDDAKAALHACENMMEVLLIHSAFINAFGKVVSVPLDRVGTEKKRISEAFTEMYEETKTILEKADTIKIFVTPEQFKKLDQQRSKRTKNIVLNYTNLSDALTHEYYKIKTTNRVSFKHPITRDLRKCSAVANSDCTTLFENVQNPLFQPLAQVIACHCSFFKQKLQKSSSEEATFKHKELINKISTGDYKFFTSKFKAIAPVIQPTILIKKYRDTDNVCEKKSYLSQLFEKTCVVLYKPHYIKPITTSKEDIIAAAKENIIIAKHIGIIYGMLGNLSVFETPILENGDQRAKAAVPVIFIIEDAGQPERVYLDYYSGPSMQFFTDVMKELLDKEVFIPTDTFFNNQRYELNSKFDIEKLQCFSRLPKEAKTAELKENITEYFYKFVGNLMHFAVVNNIELPFKLSRVYIMKLMNLFDFTKPNQNLETQLLLISIYLLEKAPALYTQQIIKIFENPKYLLDPALNMYLDPDLDDEPPAVKSKGVRTNGIYTIGETNKHIYSENNEELINNMIEYLYKTALKHIFDDINSETPSPNKKLQAFFEGMHSTVRFRKMEIPDFSTYSFEQKLGVVRKADVFLTGFGITYEIIKKRFLPLIKINRAISPLTLFNPSGSFKTEYLTDNMSLDSDVYNPTVTIIMDFIAQKEATYVIPPGTLKKIKSIFLLYRILLNRGKNISKEFIAQYNQKFFNIPYNIETTTNYDRMTDEDYHNEFVKILLKAWSGTPSILSKDYHVNIDTAVPMLPRTHTCFNTMDFCKDYTTAMSLYTDLVTLITGTNFGEALTGGKGKKKKIKV